MSLPAQLRGLTVILLCLSEVQNSVALRVNYTQTEICALESGSVEISCTYIKKTTIIKRLVKNTMWSIKSNEGTPVDLISDPDYRSRTQYLCHPTGCSLRITDLRESDSAQYQFTIKTNIGRSYTSSPGVSLSVTALQVKVRKLEYTNSYCRVELRCQSSCQPKHQSYIWIKNGQEILRETSFSVFVSVYPADKYSCALEGYKEFPSPSVYAPQLPSVSISPSAGIVENSKVILTCSSDANPAANYSWYKEDKQKPVSNESQLIFSSIQASDTGKYHCVAANPLGRKRCQQKHINVKYAPRLPSVFAIPSGETVEGSSVTLTCSSDANPGATYTWYKEGDKSPKASGQNFVISNVRPEHSGSYSCVAQNTRGRQSFSVHLTVVKDPSVKIMNIIRLTLVVLMLIPLVVLCLWTRKEETLSTGTGPIEAAEMMQCASDSVYQNISA